MNENIDLTKILKDCPGGFELYSTVHGEVNFKELNIEDDYPIIVSLANDSCEAFTKNGELLRNCNGECILFPSREMRDWSKFTTPWYKKEKFDPKALKPFDKVLACFTKQSTWCCGLFSYFAKDANLIVCCGDTYYKYCIPYNDDTKHLVGTTDEAPEYYRYWED